MYKLYFAYISCVSPDGITHLTFDPPFDCHTNLVLPAHAWYLTTLPTILTLSQGRKQLIGTQDGKEQCDNCCCQMSSAHQHRFCLLLCVMHVATWSIEYACLGLLYRLSIACTRTGNVIACTRTGIVMQHALQTPNNLPSGVPH